MIPNYINYWIKIIKTMSNQNTYKLAWGRAILEYLSLTKIEDTNYVTIKISSLSEIVLKYYWNQLFFFKLIQAPGDKAAVIIDTTKKLIELYKEKANSSLPVWYEEAKKLLGKTPEFSKSIKIITSSLRDNPAKYFPRASSNDSKKKETLPIYRINKGVEPSIIIEIGNVNYLKEYNDILARLLNHKWACLLENYNFVPKINEKITSISRGEIKRKELKKYAKILIASTIDNLPHDFYNDDSIIPDNEVSVDHVIPWSFMYSDDIWNLVLTTRKYNSSKSNIVPSEEVIEKLKIRNALLVDTIKDLKQKEVLKLSIKNNYIDKYYYQCKVAA